MTALTVPFTNCWWWSEQLVELILFLMAVVICCPTEFKWATSIISLQQSDRNSYRRTGETSVWLYPLKYMKTLVITSLEMLDMSCMHHNRCHEAAVWQWNHWHMLLRTFSCHLHQFPVVLALQHEYCKQAGLPALRKMHLLILILILVQWSIWELLLLSGQWNVSVGSTCITPLIIPFNRVYETEHVSCMFALRHVCYTAETTKEVLNLLNKFSSSLVLVAVPSWTNHCKMMRGCPYMIHYHICSHYKTCTTLHKDWEILNISLCLADNN